MQAVSLGQMDQRERLVSETGAPALLLQADHSAPRSYSDQQGEARIGAFIDLVFGGRR